jgi:ferritin
LVKELTEALDEKNKDVKKEGFPHIIEEEQTYGNSMHVSVIWDKWENVGHNERGPIILDAYLKARGDQEMLRIALPMGFTRREAERQNVL